MNIIPDLCHFAPQNILLEILFIFFYFLQTLIDFSVYSRHFNLIHSFYVKFLLVNKNHLSFMYYAKGRERLCIAAAAAMCFVTSCSLSLLTRKHTENLHGPFFLCEQLRWFNMIVPRLVTMNEVLNDKGKGRVNLISWFKEGYFFFNNLLVIQVQNTQYHLVLLSFWVYWNYWCSMQQNPDRKKPNEGGIIPGCCAPWRL